MSVIKYKEWKVPTHWCQLEQSSLFHCSTGPEPVSKMLCLKKSEIIDSVHNNS